MFTILFLLIAGHFVVDFVFQPDAVAREKSRHSETELQKVVPWFYWLTAHAFTHGLYVSWVMGSVLIGVAETLAHFVIDCGKCEGWYGIKTDQTLHILCKIFYFSCVAAFSYAMK